jgi:hypothetical protein
MAGKLGKLYYSNYKIELEKMRRQALNQQIEEKQSEESF